MMLRLSQFRQKEFKNRQITKIPILLHLLPKNNHCFFPSRFKFALAK